MNSPSSHLPVLPAEFLSFAKACDESPKLFDGTFGRGGHSRLWLEKFPQGLVVARDRDPEMVDLYRNSTAVDSRIQLECGSYADFQPATNEQFDAMLLDLGFSSLHLDYFERGFSYRFDQPLDMRYNTQEGISVSEWLREATEKEIADVLWKYGEERFSRKIASAIVRSRVINPIETVFQLRDLVTEAVPKRSATRHTVRHPYVKTFQALRIFINDELNELEMALESFPKLLKPGGRFIVISFHSLEDRMVKHSFRFYEKEEDPNPFAKSRFIEKNYRVLTKKAVGASEEEIISNPRARSAKMRVLEKKNLQE